MNRKQDEFIELLTAALNEMVKNQTILLKRGDLFEEAKRPLYIQMYEEIKDVKLFIDVTDWQDKIIQAKRYLQISIFTKNESFFMDLFETKMFPALFDLFEYE